jgi:hypothetical protein
MASFHDLVLELPSQHFIYHLRARLALRGLHHLADEKAEDLFIAASILRDLLRVSGQNFPNRLLRRGS